MFDRQFKIVKYVAASGFFIVFLATVCLHIIAEGLRVGFPTVFRITLGELPYLAWAFEDSTIGDIDIALIGALFLIKQVCSTWRKIVESQLEARGVVGINLKRLGPMSTAVAIPLLCTDAYVFYNGIANHALWGQSDVLSNFAMTVLYLSLVLAATLELVVLKQQFVSQQPEV